MKRIALIGAFDRFNYGDLLMPVIFEKQLLNKNKNVEIDYFAYQENNLEIYGAYKTKKIKQISDFNCDAAVFVGGDMLPVTYANAFMDLQTKKVNIYFYKIMKKIITKDMFENFCKKQLEGETNHPWIYSKKFLNVNKLFYNTVGGELSFYNSKIKHVIDEIDYISLRDKNSYQKFIDKKDNAKLYPDSVIALSKFFDSYSLQSLINEHTKKMQEKIDGKYFVFQSNKYIGKKDFDEIIKEIEKMYKKNGIKCLLLPIGYAYNHEDDIVLKEIYKKVKTPIFMTKKGNVYDIIYNIINSEFYVGTSLHGIITSASYSIPHIVFSNEVKKAVNFVKTWNTSPIVFCNPNELVDKYDLLMKTEGLNDILKKNSRELIELADENFNNIYEMIFNGEEDG